MKSIRLAFAVALMAATPLAMNAAPFDNSSGGAATATVGSGGDYATLLDAANAFNAVAGGINRAWTLQVLSDLTEADNVAFAQTFGAGGSLTIKPAAAVTPTITFTSTTAPAGTAFFGHLIFGSTANGVGSNPSVPDLTNTLSSNGAYTIDGSNTVGGTTRDLTITAGETVAFASPVNNLVRIVGDTDGVVIKNANLIFNDTAGTYAAVGLGGAFLSSTAVVPDNTTIENCNIVVGQITGTGGSGFALNTSVAASGTVPAGTAAIQGIIIRDNDITIRQRGIFMNAVGSATIERNNITMGNPPSALAIAPIFHFNSNGVGGWTQTWDRNVITTSSPGSADDGNGAYGVLADTGPVNGSYVITNNIIKGDFLTHTAPTLTLARGMSLGSATSTYLVEHNSISMPDDAGSATVVGRHAGITFPAALTTGTAVVRNNIVRYNKTAGVSSAYRLAATTGITMEGNTVYVPVGGRIARVVADEITDFAAWQGLGYDATATGGQFVDPAATTPAWDANLRFASSPAGLATVATSTTLVDIDGNARPATGAVPGAQQPPIATSVTQWENFH